MSYAAAMGTFDVQAFVGANLRRIREHSGKTQEDFATLLDTDQSTLSQWETGKRMARLPDLSERLERAGIDPRLLFRDQPDDDEIDADIAGTVAAMRHLPREARRKVHELADWLQMTLPRNYDPETSELLASMETVDPEFKAGVLAAMRGLLASFRGAAAGREHPGPLPPGVPRKAS